MGRSTLRSGETSALLLWGSLHGIIAVSRVFLKHINKPQDSGSHCGPARYHGQVSEKINQSYVVAGLGLPVRSGGVMIHRGR